jgi:hypothetical protein
MSRCARIDCGWTGFGCVAFNCPQNHSHVPFTLQPMGCICPPTSEKTCENRICPRKDHLRADGGLDHLRRAQAEGES